MSVVWGVALVAAIAWPGRIVGPLDGAPFDSVAKALAFGVVLPVLWWFSPEFLRTIVARTLVATLLIWKVATWMALPQAGWCGQWLAKNPPQIDGWSLTRSWDARTFWESTPPTCSAIIARGYARPTHFPAWAINMPYGQDRDLTTGELILLAEETPRPPNGVYAMNVSGAFHAAVAGTLGLLLASDVALTGDIDGRPLGVEHGGAPTIQVPSGDHDVHLRLDLTGRNWRFVPQWNGADLFSAAATATRPMTRVEVVAQRAGRWVTPAIVLVLLGWWSWWAFNAFRPDVAMLIAIAFLAAASALLASTGDSPVARFAVVPLIACVFVPVPSHLRNARGAWLLVGAPWLALIAARAVPNVGRFTLFLFGDDALMYQRFSYRIFMEGFWLEGGQRTFWNQPLYRWICGALHLLFGDSSAGETLWDGFGLLVGAMFAFYAVNHFGGFRNGVAAAVAVLLTVVLGPNWYMIGRGLSEISALLWIYLAACCLLRAGTSSIPLAVLGGVFAVLGYYTRMNHLPLVIALVALTVADGVAAGSLSDVRRLWAQTPKRVAFAYLLTLAAGVSAFAARTWHYTGEFSLFAGTSLGFNSTGLGRSVDSFWSADVWRRMGESVLMLVTVQDPPRFDWRSLLVIAGFGLSVLGLLRAPIARRLPLGIAVVCVAAVSGGLVVRASAYPGRFSLHLIPVAVTASMLMAVSLQRMAGWRHVS